MFNNKVSWFALSQVYTVIDHYPDCVRTGFKIVRVKFKTVLIKFVSSWPPMLAPVRADGYPISKVIVVFVMCRPLNAELLTSFYFAIALGISNCNFRNVFANEFR